MKVVVYSKIFRINGMFGFKYDYYWLGIKIIFGV